MIMYTVLDQESRLHGISSSSLGEQSIKVDVHEDHEVLINPYIYRLVNGGLVRDDEKHLEEQKDMKKEELKYECESSILHGFVSLNGNHYRYNSYDQMNMLMQYQELMMDSTIDHVYVDTENNGTIKHTREEFIQVYEEAKKHKDNQLTKYREMKRYVDNLETVEEVQAVTWDTY
ncbi:hypothetical protein N784_12980 [Pontibacillus litoralis JSM 072002]|uniref:DUF4376 domain-containing protein n=1 Tax=Pontibacillus litoralis JSM 072002 TaxID=1385512 RepID=A0A0A5HWQ0_9BACI|nr:hypothetical protein [Pontibacillus litoralis]KGX88032.1 hypothetical protein N784_12980 [Pontibacillus litoralis JSM 072002]